MVLQAVTAVLQERGRAAKKNLTVLVGHAILLWEPNIDRLWTMKRIRTCPTERSECT